MKNWSKRTKQLVFWLPLAVCLISGAVLLIRPDIIKLIPPCPYYNILHIYCFGCGGTRCILALLHLDFITAFRQNAVLLLLILMGILFEIQLGCSICGKNIRLVPVSPAYWWTFGTLSLAYFILRNFIPAIAPY